MTKEDLVDLFRSQNWRKRKRKDGEEVELFSADGASRMLGLKPEEMDDCLAETLKGEKHKKRIVLHIAKAMFYDGTDFDKTCRALYPWFSDKALNAVSSDAKSKLIALQTDEDKQDANSKVRTFLGLEGEGDRVNIEIEKPFEGGMESHTVAVKIPNKITSISDLLDMIPSDQVAKGDKDERTSWAARMRTDVYEILKIASATTGQSATKLVERLILMHAGKQISKAVGSLVVDEDDPVEKQAEDKLAQESGKAIYHMLRKNYHNDTTRAAFPSSNFQKSPEEWGYRTSMRDLWYPTDDETNTYQPGVTQEQALLVLMADLRFMTSSKERSDTRHADKMKKLQNYLTRVHDADEGADFATMLNQYRGYVDEPEAEVKESQTEE